MAPPKRPARSVGSVLPPAPTVSSSCTRVDREPELTSAKITTTSDNDAASHDSSSQVIVGNLIIIVTLTLIMKLVATVPR